MTLLKKSWWIGAALCAASVGAFAGEPPGEAELKSQVTALRAGIQSRIAAGTCAVDAECVAVVLERDRCGGAKGYVAVSYLVAYEDPFLNDVFAYYRMGWKLRRMEGGQEGSCAGSPPPAPRVACIQARCALVE